MDMQFFKPLLDLSKLEPLDGTNYKRWSQKMLIFFEQLEVDYVLIEVAPVVASTSAPVVDGTNTDVDKDRDILTVTDDLEKLKKI